MTITLSPSTTSHCVGTRTNGKPCGRTFGLDADGLCSVHRPGGREQLRTIQSLGGQAAAAKHRGEPLTLADFPPLTCHEDAKVALDQIRAWIGTDRCTHAEGMVMIRDIEAWLKVDAAQVTKTLLNEVTTALEAKTREIEALRRQLAQPRLSVSTR